MKKKRPIYSRNLPGSLCPECKAEPKFVWQDVGEKCFRARRKFNRKETIAHIGAQTGYGG